MSNAHYIMEYLHNAGTAGRAESQIIDGDFNNVTSESVGNDKDMETITNTSTNWTSNSSVDNNITFIYPSSPIGPEFLNAYNIYLYLMIVFGVLGNFIVLVVIIRHPPSTSTDWFILFITVCDFISSLITVPVYATFTNGYWRIYGTTLVCRLHMFLSQSLVLSSTFLISGLALDRYLKICRQFTSFSKTRARNVCILISILTTFLSIPCFMMYENRAGRCVSIVMDTTLFAYYLMVFLIFVCATIIVVFSYCKVTQAVMKSEQNMLRHARRNGNTRHTGEDGTSKVLCCCLPSIRTNRVAPLTMIESHSGLFRDTVIATISIDPSTNSGREQAGKDIDRLQVPKQPNTFIYPTPQQTSVSGLDVKIISNNSHAHSTISSQRVHKKSRRISLRTTRISFLVCSVFIVTWIPPWLCFVLATMDPDVKRNFEVVKFMMFGRMTYLMNGFSNPIIYTLLHKTFRKHIFEIFCHQKL